MTRIKTGKAILAIIELNETNLVRNKTSKKTPEQDKAVHGEIPNTNPNKVATPLPPRKSAQIGKICPNTAAKPKRDLQV